ncbi:hypothetical protein EJP77_02785 [Paenibacillus zeisoli]|uniref:Uncharacterized protein n=1 Tax=Paenibacillus zeisoli TaxID=2496267 RepID=A0A3S1BWH9_9BACL|nr:hypothetical protein [Paenibacillus zeisoli]RUT35942.1 hypothetical protein EJP77_02785 [Paenibacillus zeisoli]
MLENTRKILWLAAGLTLWLTALFYTWSGITLSNQALERASDIGGSQNRSVSLSTNKVTAETYTGAEVLVIMQERHKEHLDVELQGRLYPSQIESEVDFPAEEVSLTSSYEVKYVRDTSGEIKRVSFNKMN